MNVEWTNLVLVELVVEGFEILWSGNESYVTSLDGAIGAIFAHGSDPDDTSEYFEQSWLNDVYDTDWATVTWLDTAGGGVGVPDTFAVGWNVGSYLLTFAGPELDPFIFTIGGSTGAAETFEEGYPPRPLAMDQNSGIITAPSHGLAPDDIVMLVAGPTGQLPGGFAIDTPYYAQVITPGAFGLALTFGGAVETPTYPMLGSHYFTRSPAEYWPEGL